MQNMKCHWRTSVGNSEYSFILSAATMYVSNSVTDLTSTPIYNDIYRNKNPTLSFILFVVERDTIRKTLRGKFIYFLFPFDYRTIHRTEEHRQLRRMI